MTKLRIVCAAVRAADGGVIVGVRHYSMDMRVQIMNRIDGRKFMNRPDDEQGFVDQYGNFHDRYEAYKIAHAAGQILWPDACGNGIDGPKLYSEGLYEK